MPGFKNRAARKGSPDIVEGRTGLLEFLRPEENRVVVVREAGGIGVSGFASGGSVQDGPPISHKNHSIKGAISGGYITGPGSETSDSIPAFLSKGEYVVKADAVKRIGVDVLDAINRGSISHYASGGSVQDGRLIGDSGPELLRLAERNNTTHIGKEKETADNRPIVNIEIINNTGTPMKAREESTFDGMRQLRKIIIDTASSAAYTNEGGFRDAIQGAAAARG